MKFLTPFPNSYGGAGLPGDRRFSAEQPSPGYVKLSIRVFEPLMYLTILRKELPNKIL